MRYRPLTTTRVDVVMAESDMHAQEPLSNKNHKFVCPHEPHTRNHVRLSGVVGLVFQRMHALDDICADGDHRGQLGPVPSYFSLCRWTPILLSHGALVDPSGNRAGISNRYELSGSRVDGTKPFRAHPQSVPLVTRSKAMSSVVVSMGFRLRSSVMMVIGTFSFCFMRGNTLRQEENPLIP